MKVKELYQTVKKILIKNKVEAADFEAAELLRAFAGCDRAKLLSHSELEADAGKVLTALEKRVNGTPLQYLIGSWNFWGREFFVGEGVLIPRPDTEVLVEETLKEIKGKKAAVADLCSGSGCIAVTLAKECECERVYALEKSDAAFSYLKRNIERHSAPVTPLLCDVLKTQDIEPLDVVVSNPPYIPTNVISTLSDEVKKEPNMALDGGEDGLYFYREITRLWKDKLKNGGVLLFEIGFDQAQAVSKILKENGFTQVTVIKDFGGNDRVVKGVFE